MQKTSDLRISGRQEVISASTLMAEQPISEKSSETVFNARKAFSEILFKKDKRLAVVVGPCSIHDTDAAMEYANLLLKELSKSGSLMRPFQPTVVLGFSK